MPLDEAVECIAAADVGCSHHTGCCRSGYSHQVVGRKPHIDQSLVAAGRRLCSHRTDHTVGIHRRTAGKFGLARTKVHQAGKRQPRGGMRELVPEGGIVRGHSGLRPRSASRARLPRNRGSDWPSWDIVRRTTTRKMGRTRDRLGCKDDAVQVRGAFWVS